MMGIAKNDFFYYENNQSQIKLAYNDFLYDANKGD